MKLAQIYNLLINQITFFEDLSMGIHMFSLSIEEKVTIDKLKLKETAYFKGMFLFYLSDMPITIFKLFLFLKLLLIPSLLDKMKTLLNSQILK